MDVRRPHPRLPTTTPEFYQNYTQDCDMIKHIQSDILRTSRRIKQLSLNDRQFEEVLARPAEHCRDLRLRTDKRGNDDPPLHDIRNQRQRSDTQIGLGIQACCSREGRSSGKLHSTLASVLGRLKDLPTFYATFKRRNLSVREILANSSEGNTDAVLQQVLEFLGQLMTLEQDRNHKLKHRSRGVQFPSRRSSMSPLNSRRTLSSVPSSTVSPARSPYSSRIGSPRVNLQRAVYENFSAAVSRGSAVEDFLTPITSAGPVSFSKDEDFKLMDESGQMLSMIQAQSARIANLHKQIFSTMANGKKLLGQPALRTSNLTETQGLTRTGGIEVQLLTDSRMQIFSPGSKAFGSSSEYDLEDILRFGE